MNPLKLTKSNVIKFLNTSEDFSGSIDVFIKNILKLDNIAEPIKHTYISRQQQMNDFLRGLNRNLHNLFLIAGFQGTGKTTFIKAASFTLESNVLFFYYECSKISNLDDIILALYTYLQQFSFKDTKAVRSGKSKESIDEKLVDILNAVDRPMVVVIDSFENILKEHSEIKDVDLKKFLEYLLGLKQVRLVLAGKKVPVLNFKNYRQDPLTIRFSGLEKYDAENLLEWNGSVVSKSNIDQVLEDTRGYPESLKFLSTAAKLLKVDIADLLQEYSNFDDNFESYIFQKIYNTIPATSKEIVDLFVVIRHPLRKSVLKELNLFSDIEAQIDYLASVSILAENNQDYYIKEFFKDIIYSEISDESKYKFHSFLLELYKDQVDKPLKDRILNLSKNLLYSEKYYHQSVIAQFKKKLKAEAPKPTPILISSYYTNKYDLTYLPQNVSNIETKKVKNEKKDLSDTPKKEKKLPPAVSQFDDTSVVLTEEEKNLLGDDNDEEFIYEGELFEEETSENKQNKDQNSTEKYNTEKNIFLEKSSETLKKEYLTSAKIFEEQGKTEMAISCYKKAYDVLVDLKEYISIPKIAAKVADLYISINKSDSSIEYLLKALGLFTNINDRHNVVVTIFKLAELYNQTYKHEMALKYYYMILNTDFSVPENIENKSLIGIGNIYNYRKDYNLALKFYIKAFQKVRFYEDIETKCTLCFKIALICDDLDEIDKALYYYNKNLEISTDADLNPYLSAVYSNIAVIYDEKKLKIKAINYYKKSLEIDKLLNYYEGQYKTWSTLASLYFEQGVKDETVKCLSEGVQAAKLSGDKYCMAMSFLDVGDYYLSQKIYSKAVKAFIKAKKTIGQVISTDSKEKIDRRFKQIIMEIGEKQFNQILESFRKKND